MMPDELPTQPPPPEAEDAACLVGMLLAAVSGLAVGLQPGIRVTITERTA